VVTKSLDDFGVIADLPDTAARILRIPAPLLCYWMGESRHTGTTMTPFKKRPVKLS